MRSLRIRYICPHAERGRGFEDAVIEHLATSNAPVFAKPHAQMVNVDWFILSARRANKLLSELLFGRVYALRIRGFAEQFHGAELDMDLSPAKDLVPLRQFPRVLREEGMTKVTTLMERGDF